MVTNSLSGKLYDKVLGVTLNNPEDCVVVEVNGYKLVINHNDVGVSVDIYDDTLIEERLVEENQYWWCDLKFEP